MTAKKIAINMTDLNIIINSISEEKITSFLENPKILVKDINLFFKKISL